ncbi:hypothetical protein AXF42_Ash017782 [Apostasia shenzhenica]|uniref:Uncharacterized protein n=1 Tax=Apostasia shenzhenica TaxID=1088818 RepID=A0A2I0B688_9ASPA|nr:hypothetical protein AXF42_Ash017782 [Apostasia shenzhenica]
MFSVCISCKGTKSQEITESQRARFTSRDRVFRLHELQRNEESEITESQRAEEMDIWAAFGGTKHTKGRRWGRANNYAKMDMGDDASGAKSSTQTKVGVELSEAK